MERKERKGRSGEEGEKKYRDRQTDRTSFILPPPLPHSSSNPLHSTSPAPSHHSTPPTSTNQPTNLPAPHKSLQLHKRNYLRH
ncbi:hypothetical protein Pcinc_040362 [Petrolisthes cinctipes]|uniref:Uncharacterized protein n=1 Tax=Petrolisthes cinctipes TaxID=88211 RepID=A0AAE1EIP6_PETCI|nr:hypothetical protein Pcinc_040362 [Petrolisthes cinctipes]